MTLTVNLFDSFLCILISKLLTHMRAAFCYCVAVFDKWFQLNKSFVLNRYSAYESSHSDMHFHAGGDLTYTLYEQFKAINKRQWLFTVEPGQPLATY